MRRPRGAHLFCRLPWANSTNLHARPGLLYPRCTQRILITLQLSSSSCCFEENAAITDPTTLLKNRAQ